MLEVDFRQLPFKMCFRNFDSFPAKHFWDFTVLCNSDLIKILRKEEERSLRRLSGGGGGCQDSSQPFSALSETEEQRTMLITLSGRETALLKWSLLLIRDAFHVDTNIPRPFPKINGKKKLHICPSTFLFQETFEVSYCCRKTVWPKTIL